MFRFFNRTTSATQSTRHRRHHSKRFWCLLGGSSILLHIGLIHWVKVAQNQASIAPFTSHVTPIDWVELPTSEPAESSSQPTEPSHSSQQGSQAFQAQAASDQTAPPPPISKTTLSEADHSAIAVESAPDSDLEAESTSAVIESASPEDSFSDQSIADPGVFNLATALEPDNPISDATTDDLDPSAPNMSEDMTLEGASSAISTTSAESESLSTAVADSQPSLSPSEEQAPQNRSERIESIATATPTPLLSTQRIDVPLPDVSGNLPVAEDSGPDLAANVTEQISIPSQLTASLTATSLPPERDQVLDEVAEPTTDIHTFSSNPASSPCRVTPEAMPFLGKTVAMQVITNEKGEVVHTITHESSQSMAYDELAICLVKNWTFAPAIARGQPVANDGLVVHITIDRS